MKIVKICKKHGDLTIDQVWQETTNLRTYFRCIACRRKTIDKRSEAIKEYSREYEKTKRKRPDDYYEKVVKPKSREWRQKNKDLVNARVALDRSKNPEKYREYDRNWRKNNLDRARKLDVAKKRGISYEEYVYMIDAQKGLCAICNKKEIRKSKTKGEICMLVVDHNHSTGKIRELLCHRCNIGIGKFKENTDIMEKAILYIKKHNFN